MVQPYEVEGEYYEEEEPWEKEAQFSEPDPGTQDGSVLSSKRL